MKDSFTEKNSVNKGLKSTNMTDPSCNVSVDNIGAFNPNDYKKNSNSILERLQKTRKQSEDYFSCRGDGSCLKCSRKSSEIISSRKNSLCDSVFKNPQFLQDKIFHAINNNLRTQFESFQGRKDSYDDLKPCSKNPLNQDTSPENDNLTISKGKQNSFNGKTNSKPFNQNFDTNKKEVSKSPGECCSPILLDKDAISNITVEKRLKYQDGDYRIGVYIENGSDLSEKELDIKKQTSSRYEEEKQSEFSYEDSAFKTSNKNKISPLLVVLPLANNKSMNKKQSENEIINKAKKVGIKDFNILSVLGSGSYSNVYLCTKKNDKTKKKFALKVVDKDFAEKQRKVQDFLKERELISTLNHENIIKLESSFQNSYKFYFVLEHAEKGDMITYLGDNILDASNIIYFVAQILNALDYLHSKDIAHRDLKLDNIVLDKNMKLKLIDFHSAYWKKTSLREKQRNNTSTNHSLVKNGSMLQKREDNHDNENEFLGTAEYIAPELLHGKCKDPFKLDAWALGIITYKLLHGYSPFKGTSELATYRKINKYVNGEKLKFNPVSLILIILGGTSYL